MSSEALTKYRVEQLEHRVDAVGADVADIKTTMHSIRDAMEASEKESSAYRKDVRRDIKCMSDTWHAFEADYGEMLREFRRARDERKKTRRQITVAWITAGGIGAWHAWTEWISASGSSAWRAFHEWISR